MSRIETFTPIQLIQMYRMEHASRRIAPCLSQTRCIACQRADTLIHEAIKAVRDTAPELPLGAYNVVTGELNTEGR